MRLRTGRRSTLRLPTVANLAGFLRMPGAFIQSIDIAIDKAYTAAGFGFSTRTLDEGIIGHTKG